MKLIAVISLICQCFMLRDLIAEYSGVIPAFVVTQGTCFSLLVLIHLGDRPHQVTD